MRRLAAARRDVRAKVDAGYLLEATRKACLAIVGAILDMLVMAVCGDVAVGDIKPQLGRASQAELKNHADITTEDRATIIARIRWTLTPAGCPGLSEEKSNCAQNTQNVPLCCTNVDEAIPGAVYIAQRAQSGPRVQHCPGCVRAS